MTDYLQPVGNGLRRIAVLICLPAALVAAAVTALVVTEMVQRGRIDNQGKPLWIAAVVCTLIAVACGWMSVRLWSGRSANGVTILPLWFIELFGAVFLAAGVWAGIENGWGWGGGAGIGVALSMLSIRRAIRRRRSGADDRG
jgi:hypothetical protein